MASECPHRRKTFLGHFVFPIRSCAEKWSLLTLGHDLRKCLLFRMLRFSAGLRKRQVPSVNRTEKVTRAGRSIAITVLSNSSEILAERGDTLWPFLATRFVS